MLPKDTVNQGLVDKTWKGFCRFSRNPMKPGITFTLLGTCSPRKLGKTIDVVSAPCRITMIYQRLAKVFLIRSRASEPVLAPGGSAGDSPAGLNIGPFRQAPPLPLPAIVCVPHDGTAKRRRRGRRSMRTAVGTAEHVPRGSCPAMIQAYAASFISFFAAWVRNPDLVYP